MWKVSPTSTTDQPILWHQVQKQKQINKKGCIYILSKHNIFYIYILYIFYLNIIYFIALLLSNCFFLFTSNCVLDNFSNLNFMDFSSINMRCGRYFNATSQYLSTFRGSSLLLIFQLWFLIFSNISLGEKEF